MTQDFQSRHGRVFEALKPLRMFPVGSGADDKTERMVNFLANKDDMNVSRLTFHGVDYDGKISLDK